MDHCTYSANGVLFSGGKKLATYVKAYFDRHWDGRHGYFYTPPEKSTEWSAAAVSGNVCHIAFSIFKAYHNSANFAHKALVKKCLGLLLPDPLIKTECVPSTARVTLTRKDDYILLHVKVDYPERRGKMDIIEEHNRLAAGAVVYVKCGFTSARSLPDEESVQANREGVYLKVTLPAVSGYRMIQIM